MTSKEFNRRMLLRVAAGATLGSCMGCPGISQRQPQAVQPKSPPQPLAVLVVDDPPLAEAISREWRGRTEEELTVKQVTLLDLDRASRLPGDAVIFPSGLMGQLAERGFLLPIEHEALEDSDFNFRDIFDQVRLREMRWGGHTIAAPLGSPQLLLCYRARFFEEFNLALPTDWASYQQLVEQLARLPISKETVPVIEPRAPGWAGQTLLARAAAYAMHRDQVSPLFKLGTTEPLIHEPPFVRALEELVAAAKTAGNSQQGLTPADAFTSLQGGKSAMSLTWPHSGSASEPPPSPETASGKLAFAPLPTSREAYRFATKSWEPRDNEDSAPLPLLAIAGRMAAVSASTQDAPRAGAFVIWLASRGVSERVAGQSPATTLFRQSHVAQSSSWTPRLDPDESRQYAETLSLTLSAPRAMPGITIPGRAEYLAALDQAVYQAMEGTSAAKALAEATKHWQEITTKLGADSQRRAIARSLGQPQMSDR